MGEAKIVSHIASHRAELTRLLVIAAGRLVGRTTRLEGEEKRGGGVGRVRGMANG